MKKVLIVTEAGAGQVNGVITTLHQNSFQLDKWGYAVHLLEPDGVLEAKNGAVQKVQHIPFRTVPLPRYPEIRFVLDPWRSVDFIKSYQPDFIHIATEGPLGRYVAKFCQKNGFPYTTSYHTKFPEYAWHYYKIPVWATYPVVRRFHAKAAKTLVTTPSMRRELVARKFCADKLVVWWRGVDLDLFHPRQRRPDLMASYGEGPFLLYVGRVAREKNLEAFLSLDVKGTKVVVGDGPQRPEFRQKYPDVKFAGYQRGADLAAHFASSDVFVFPSKTDAFGLVMLEAMACGVPVAAFPVTGPVDVIKPGETGFLNTDLKQAIEDCLTKIDRKTCRAYVEEQGGWQTPARIMEQTLVRIN